MLGRKIIESTIELGQSCLSKEEQEEVKYRGAFSLRDEIVMCPNIVVDLQVIKKSPFHVKDEDKTMIEKEMQRLVHLGILKKDMSQYSSPIMLIARKNSLLKRIITGFRFLNSRVQRVNLAFLLIRNMFAILGCLKCECLSVLDLKDAYHTVKLSENSKP